MKRCVFVDKMSKNFDLTPKLIKASYNAESDDNEASKSHADCFGRRTTSYDGPLSLLRPKYHLRKFPLEGSKGHPFRDDGSEELWRFKQSRNRQRNHALST